MEIVVLAAGKGTRMKSSLPKVLHKIAGFAMLDLVIRKAAKLSASKTSLVVSGNVGGSEEFKSIVSNANLACQKLTTVVQENPMGTGHALQEVVRQGGQFSGGNVVILYADTPLTEVETLKKMERMIEDESADLMILAFHSSRGEKYGKLVTDKFDRVTEIVEHAEKEYSAIESTLSNSGVMVVKGSILNNLLPLIKNRNSAGEFYLTDIVKLVVEHGGKVGYVMCDRGEVLGINSQEELSCAEALMQESLRKKHMQNGVSMTDPKTVYFSFDTEVESGVLIEPNVFFGTGVSVKEGSKIRAFSYIEGARIAKNCSVGPFARIRPYTEVLEGCRVGNFVEIKNSTLKNGSLVGHLSYVGDAEIGEGVNVGAGAITCNYDGVEKHRTVIEDGCFIGSNSCMVAPIKLGANCLVAAGSVVTRNAEENSLVVSRSNQQNINNKGMSGRRGKKKVL